MNLQQKVINISIDSGMIVLKALLVLFVGFPIINIFVKFIEKLLMKSKIDASLHSFIKSLISISLKIVICLTVATMLGIPITTFVAALGAAGLAIGLALKDSLSNFAGGILILAFRPFNVGEYIQIDGMGGIVKEINPLFTHIVTSDNKKIIIPNGDLTNAKITNLSVEETRRVDMNFRVGYSEDVVIVKEILCKIVSEHPLTLKEPEPIIRVKEHGECAIILDVKVWCKNQDYWTVYYDMNEQVKITFDKEGISIPYPQMDVKLTK